MGYTIYGKVDTLEEFEELIEEDNFEEDNLQDAMINATVKGGFSGRYLFDLYKKRGLMGVYNLGLKHMYEYLKGCDEQHDL